MSTHPPIISLSIDWVTILIFNDITMHLSSLILCEQCSRMNARSDLRKYLRIGEIDLFVIISILL